MIFGNMNNNRLPYAVAKITETLGGLVVNGEFYDKKTLAKLTSTIMDQGYNDVKKFKNYFNMSVSSNASNSEFCVSSYNQLLNRIRNKNKVTTMLSIIDNKASNIEWTIAGDTVIKYDYNSRNIKLYRDSTRTIIGGVILYQDTDYIYFLGNNGEEHTSTQAFTLNKANGVLKTITLTTPLTGSYTDKINVIHVEDSISVIQHYNMGTHVLYKFVCGSGTITNEAIPVTESALDIGSYCDNIMSGLDKNKYSYYVSATDSSLVCVKIEDAAVQGPAIKGSLLDNDKIKVDSFLESKYSLSAMDSGKREKYLKIKTDAVTTAEGSRTGYRSIECLLMGKNEEFLVLISSTDKDSIENKTNKGDDQTCFIAVFKRNSPTTDPMDLTLVDYMKFDEFVLPYGYPKEPFKLNDNKLFMTNSFGVMELNVTESTGKLVIKKMLNPNIICIGYDSFGRLYVIESVDSHVNIYNEKTPYDLKLKYENKNDAYVQYNGRPEVKNVIATACNYLGDKIQASFELMLSGPAEFVDTSSQTYIGQTELNGEKQIGIKIKKPGDVNLDTKILFNNELAIIDKD